MPNPPAVAFATLLALTACATTLAAPATSQDLSPSNPPGSATDPSLGASPTIGTTPGGATTVPQSAAVELLLQMQDRPGGMQDGAAKGQGAGSLKRDPSAAEGVDLRTGLRAALLETLEQKPVGQQDATAPSSHAPLGGMRSGAVEAGSPPARSTADSGSSILAHPAVRFIRENRLLTIGISVAVLVALWASSTFSFRRRSR